MAPILPLPVAVARGGAVAFRAAAPAKRGRLARPQARVGRPEGERPRARAVAPWPGDKGGAPPVDAGPSGGGVPPAPASRLADKTDWPAFLGRHDLVWDGLPTGWADGAFLGNGLVGAMVYREGNNRVSAARRAGKTEIVRIHSLAGEPCRIQTDLPPPYEVQGPEGMTVNQVGDILEVTLAKGQELILTTQGTTPALEVAPVPLPAGGCANYFGSGRCHPPGS